MAKKLGTIKSISGSTEVIAVDKSGNQRVLKVGDSLYEGESVKTTSADSKVVIATNNGKELSMIGEDTLTLDPKATAGDAQVAALQKALLNGANLGDLEETAAGGTSGGRAGDGVSLGSASFEQGGHYSNISASTSAINSLGGFGFASPETGVRGGLDNGGTGGGTGFYIDTTAPVVTINSIKPVDQNNPADGNPDKGIVKGHSDEPNAPVVVKDKDGKIIGTGTTDDKGNFEVTTDPIKPGDKVTVEVTDKAGNTGKGDGTAGNTVYTDTTPPTVDVTTVTPVDQNNPADGNPDKGIVKGHSDEPNAPVVVKDKDGKIIGTGTTDDKGNFEVTTDPIKPGDKVTVEVTDKAGNTGKGDGTAGNTVYTDTTPPTVDVTTVTPVDQNNPADGNPDKGIVKGHSDEPNAPVVVKDKDGKIIGTGTTDDKGNFEVTTDPIKPGDKVTVEVTDKAGNTGKGDGTAGNTVYTDTTPPTVDVTTVTPVDQNNPADGNPDKGIVKGHSDEPNAPVVITDKDGNEIGRGTTDGNGGFTIETKPFNPGDPITATVTDKAGNKGSDTENAGNLTHPNDTTATSDPTITFVEDINPKDGKLNKSENGSDSDNANTTAKISIPTDAVVNDVIKYTVNGEEKSHPITEADKAKGHIEVKVPVVDGQTSTITAKIVDQAGNASKEVSGSVDVDLTIGNPKVRFLEDTDNNGVLSVAEVAAIKDGKAHWVIDIPTDGSVKAGDVIQSIDSKGNWVKFVTITDEMIKDGRFEATFNVDIEKLRNGKYETPEYRFADDAGNISDSSKATLALDGEFSRTPSSPLDINFLEDVNKDGKISNKENEDGDKEVGKTTAEISIPKDGSVKPGDKLIVKDNSDTPKEHVITDKDIENGKVEVTVDIKTGDKTTITAEIVNPSNPSKPSEEISKDITEASSTVQVTIDEIYDDVAGGVVNGDVKNGLTNDNLPTFKGSAAAGATVEIYESFLTTTEKTLVGKTVADANGKWSFTPTEAMGDGLHYFEAHATDSAGNKSITPKVELDVDATAPSVENLKVSPLDISNPADNTPEKGRVEGSSDTQDAKVIVKDEAGNVIGEGKVGGDGKFVIDTTKALNPGDKVKVEITDEAGNTGKGDAVTGKDIIHTHATTQVTIDEIYDDVAGGVVNGDVKNGLTNDNLPTFKGSAAAGATVEIYESFLTTTEKTLVGKTVADANGKWSFTPTEAMGDGLHYFEAHATDSAGNKSITPKVELDVDATAPSVENLKVSPLDISNPADNTPEKGRVEGSSDTQDAKVIVKDEAGNVIGEGKVGGDGKFVIDTTKALNPGDKVKVEITDEAGNTGKGDAVTGKDIIHTHATTQVTIDEIYDDVAGGVVNGDVKNGLTNDNLPTFKGSAAAGATVEIYESFLTTTEKTLVGKTVADANGKWSFTPTEAMGDGLHYFEAHATDSAGNKSITPKVELDVDATAPSVENLKVSPLDISNPADNTPEKGRVEGSSDTQDAKVIVKDEAGNVIGEGKVGGDGKFVIDTTKALNPGDKVKVEITDEAGNTGKGDAVTGKDIIHTHATTQVTIDEIYDDVAGGVVNGDVKNGLTNDNLPTFKGSAAAGATVEIYESFLTTTEKTLVGKTVADANGKWSFTPTEAMGDGLHYFEAHATDSAGNKSITPKVELDVDATAPSVENLKVSPLDISNPADNTPEKGRVEGSSDTQDAKVIVKDEAGNVIGEGKVGGDGKFVIDTTKALNPGDKVKVEITDEAGNTGKGDAVTGKDIIHTHATTQVTIDEIYDDVAGGVVNGDVKNGLTNDNLPTFKGSAAAGATVEIYESFLTTTEKTLVGKTVADANGKWSFTPTEAMGDGLHYFEAHATDSAGNKSITPKVELDVDATAPSVENLKVSPLDISNPADNTPEKGRVEGSSDTQDAKVIVKDEAGNVIGEGKVGGDGKFVIDTTKALNPGDKVKVEITDEAGNTGKGDAVTGKDIIHTHATTQVTIDEIYDDVAGGVVNGDVKNGLTNDNLPTFKGSAAPGATVEIYESFLTTTEKTLVGKTVADANGKWSFTPTEAMGDGLHYFEALATDSAGNKSITPKVELDVDATAPSVENLKVSPLDISNPADNTPEKGRVEGSSDTQDAKVIVKDEAGNVIGEGKVGGDGKFSIDTTKPLNPGDKVKVEIIDEAGNTGKGSAVTGNDIIHTHATTQVTIDEIYDDVAGGVVNGDVKNGLTNDNLPTFKGSAAPGATVEIYESFLTTTEKTLVGKTVADANGKWSFTPTEAMGDGLHYFEALATDSAGNKSITPKVELDVDATAPSVENLKVSPLDISNPADNTPEKGRVEGSSDTQDAKVIVKDEAGNVIGEGKVGGDGKFSIDTTKPLNPGDKVKVEIIDEAGNTGKGSAVTGNDIIHTHATTQVTIDEIYDDVAGGVVNGDVKNGLTNDNLPTFKGSAAPGATVEIYESFLTTTEKTLVGKTVADANGKWSFTPTEAMGDGLHYFEALATDSAGNKSITPKVELDVDATAPSVENLKVSPLDISNPADNTPEKGRVEGSSDTQDAKVIVKDEAGNVIGEGKVGGDGKFSIDTTKPLNPGDKVKVEIIDEAGNTGKGSAVTGNDIIHTHATTQVTIDEIYDDVAGGVVNGDVKNGLTNDNLPTFKGSAAPGATVEIYESFLTTTEKTLVGKTVADANGKWSFTPTEAMGDGLHYFEALATDSAGNKSITPKVELDVDATAPSVENLKVSPLDISNPADNTPEKGRVEGSSDTQDAKVIVKDEAGNVIGEGKVGGDGKFSIDTTKPLNPGDKVKVEIIDEAGNTGKGSAVTGNDIIHTHATTQVTIDEIYDDVAGGVVNGDVKNGLTNDNLPTFKGSAAPGATVEIYESFLTTTEKTLVGKTVADANGKWSFTPTEAMGDGLHYFEALATDSAGNKSITPKVELDVDATAPSVENLKVSPLDISNPADNTPEKGRVEGSSDTQDAKVIVKDEAGNVIGEGKVGGDGKFSIDTTKPLNPGDKVKVEIIDEAGNTGKGSAVTGNDIIHTHATTQVTIDEIYDDVAGGVVNGDVKNGLTNDNLPTFKGSAAPGATVEIYESFLTTTEKTLVGKTVADANGKWSFTPTEAMGDGLHYFEALATDSAGNKSITPKVELDVDATAPSVENLKVSPLDISNPADNTPEKGRVEGSSDTQDAKVIVKDEAGNVIGEGKVGGDGKFSIDTTKPLNPGDKVKVEIIDEAGNTGKGSAVTGNDIIHTHATTQVTIDEIYDDVAGGVVNGDVKNGLTNDNLPTFKGSAAPGATVEIYESFLTTTEKTLVGKTVADANGKWSFTPTEAMGDGLHYFEALATDSAGNKSITPKVELDVDATADAPVIDAVNDNVDSHTGNVLDAKTKVALTNDSTPTLEGYAEPNSVVTIYEISELNGEKTAIGTVTADKHGGWKFELPELGDGEYQYTTRAQDKAGNISDFSETVIVNVDLVAPSEPTITFVEDINKKDGKLNKAENGKDGDDASTTAQISVPGDAVENDVIHYTVNGEEKTHTITYNDRVAGYIEVKVPVVDGKTSTVTAKIVDQAGNASEVVKESISSDFTAPNVQITGIIDNVPGGTYKDNVAGTSTNDNKPTIKGKADANQEVVIYDTNKEIGRTTADKNGNWEFKPSDYKEPLADLVGRVHVIKAVVTDAAGNTSEATSALEVDTTVGTPKVKFKEDLNSNEVLSVEEAKALTDGKLHWIVEIPTDGISVKAGDTLQVYGKNAKWQNAAIITNDDIAKGFVERDGFVMDLPKGNGAQSPAYRIVDKVGNESAGDFANLVYDKELTRQPSNPSIKFPEDTNEDGKISDKENKEGDKDAGKTTAEVIIPQDGSVKPGDKLIVTDDKGKETVRPIEQSDIDKGSIDVPVDLNPGKDNTIIAEIVNPNNPDNPGKGKGVIGENSEATKAPEAPVITDVIDDVEGGKFNQSVKGGLTNDNTPTIKGTAKAGSTVVIYDNGVEIGRIEKADANWEFTTPVLTKQGEHKFTAIAENAFGTSVSSNEVTIDLDTTAPTVENVKVTPIDMSNPADSTPEKGRVEGRSDTPGAIVVIKDQAGNEIGRDNVKADKSFTIETTKPINKGDKVTVEITDEAGNTGKGDGTAGNVKHEGDNAAPCDPTITFVEDINPKDNKLNKAENGSDSDNANTTAKISFLPDVVKGDVIKYTINNGKEESYTVTADDVKAGYIEVKVPVVDGKTSTVTAKIVDQAGNASKEVSGSVDVDLSVDAPKVRITADADDNNILTATEASTLTDGKLKWVIELPKDAKEGDRLEVSNNHRDWVSVVTLTAADIKAGTITRDDFSADLVKGKLGFQTPSYRIVDQAGNISAEDTDAVKFEKSASRAPVITEVFDDQSGSALIDAKNKTIGNVLGKNNGLTNDNTPTFKGTAEVGTTITLKNGNVVIGKDIPVNADGTWEFTPSAKLADGRYNIVATSTNIFGTESTPSNIAAVTVDTDPGAVLIKEVIDDVKGGKFNQSVLGIDKGLTNDNTPTLKGTAEPESIVEIKVDGKVIGTTTTTTEGTWSYQVTTPIKDGSRKVSVISHDKAGNISSEVAETINVDTITPAPTIDKIIDNKEGGKFKEDVKGGITNDNRPVIEGTAEAHATVELFDNGKSMGTTKAGEDGKWTLRPEKPMADGNHVITAKATDLAGNENWSKVSASSDISTDAGVVKITAVCDNVAGWNNQTGNVLGINGGLTNDNTPTIKGTAKPGMAITIKNGDQVIEGNVEYAKDGSWEFTPKTPLADGLYNITAVATSNTGAQSVSNVAAINVDARIADAKVEFIEDANNDGKFSWKENIENPNIGRMAWKAIIPQDGSIKEGDIFHYRWGNQDSWHSREVKQSDIDRGFIGEKVQNQYEQGQPNAGKPLAFGANANGRVYEAEAYFTDAAGNIGKSDSDKVVFDFSDRPAKHIKINAEAIYESNKLGLFMEKHGPVLKASTEVQPYINSDDHYELDVKTITHGAHLKFGAGDDVINIHTRGGWGWINEGSVLNLGHGHNNLTVATNVDVSTVIAGNGNDTVVIDGWLTNNSTVKLGDGDNKLTVGTNIDKSTVLAGSGNDEVVVGQWQHAGDSWVTNRSTLHLGDGDNKITVGTNIDSSSIETGKGNDVVKVGGYIHNSKVDLGAGDDTLVVGKADLANSKVDGGTGYDKLVLDNPGKSVNLSDISKFASNFEELDISGANNTKLNVNIKDVLEMTDDKNTLKITGDKGDTVDLKENIGAGGWNKGASEDGYTTYTNNTVTIQIKDEIHVI